MTLPFRRRHHDDEASHDRARALFSAGFLGPLSESDEAWLKRHLERCPECRADRASYETDRQMLRGLRDRTPEPPRDLWARTAAAIERQGHTPPRRGPLGLRRLRLSRGLPYGPLAGALVALVVLVVAVMPRNTPTLPPSGTISSSQVAVGTEAPGSTPLLIPADQVAWIQSTGDGHYSIVVAPVDEVCASADQGCTALAGSSPAPLLDLAAPPQAVVLSPGNRQVAVVGAAGESAGSVVIVAVPTPNPAGSLAPTVPVITPVPTSPVLPTESAAGSPGASATSVPIENGHAIIHDVIVVGEAGYSDNGEWFAFSARPQSDVGGPDLYAWHVGDDQARRLTDNGATFFSGWFKNRIVASEIVPQGLKDEPDASGAPASSEEPAATIGPTPASPSGKPAPSAIPEASVAIPVAAEAHPISFLLDPATGAREDFARPDVWLPAIDPTGRFVTYWSGTVLPEGSGPNASGPNASTPPLLGFGEPGRVPAWRPATGRLVLDGWSAPLASPLSSGEPSATPSDSRVPTSTHAAGPAVGASPKGASPTPSAPTAAVGPAGTPIVLAEGPLGDFRAAFDPAGKKLAVWTQDPDDNQIGPLWLVVLDPVAGGSRTIDQPLQSPGTVALRGFSLKEGRLGWVTPPGQDGQPSSVRVLGWTGDDFGQVQTVPGGNPQIVR
jgi:hypothetical protein